MTAPVSDQSREEPVAQMHKIEEKIWLSKLSYIAFQLIFQLLVPLWILQPSEVHGVFKSWCPDASWASAEYSILGLTGFPFWRNGF